MIDTRDLDRLLLDLASPDPSVRDDTALTTPADAETAGILTPSHAAATVLTGPRLEDVVDTLHTLRSLSLAREHEVLVGGEPAVAPHRDAVRRALAAGLQPPTSWLWR